MISPTAIIVISLWLIAFGVTMLLKRSPVVLCSAVLAGYLFLPQFEYDIPGFTFSKLKIITLAAGCAAFLVDKEQRPKFRPGLLDLPALGLPVAAFVASMTNGLGAYDGFVVGLSLLVQWTVPWFVGRGVFATHDNARIVAQCTVAAALIYVPFCVYEMRMAPVLHQQIYGYGARGAESLRGLSMRFGMWRPNVFTQTGLELSLFMGLASVIALWGRTADELRHERSVSPRIAPLMLAATTGLSFSTGAIVLTAISWLMILGARTNIMRLVLLFLALAPLCYPIYRMVNPGAIVINVGSDNSEFADRKASLRARIVSEDRFLARWKLQPVFGWTSRYYLQTEEQAVPDSLWIQTLCKFGLAGWICFTMILLLPVYLIWKSGLVAAGGQRAEYVLALCVLLFLSDCMFNAMENPVYLIMAGAAAGMPSRIHLKQNSISIPQPEIPRRPIRMLWPRRDDSGRVG